MITFFNSRIATRLVFLSVVYIILVCASCTTGNKHPNIGEIYNKAAQHEELGRNPVIVIPGILGSRLKEDSSGAVAWGAFGGGSIDPTSPEGMRIVSLPMAKGAPLSKLRDDVIPDGVLSKLKIDLFGLPVELSAYREILASLGAGGYRDSSLLKEGYVDYGDDHFTCFQYAYDWRLDISQNASILDSFIKSKRAYVQNQIEKRYGIKDYPVKFDIVAHSMGGLLSRYYLMYGANPLPDDGTIPEVTWSGATHIDRVIMIGTPNAGSTQAFRELIEGVQFSSVVPKYEAAVLGTMPSIYELLPRTRHGAIIDSESQEALDIFDPELWITRGWGLADPIQDEALVNLLPEIKTANERKEIAYDHLRKSLKRAKQFTESVDRKTDAPHTLEFYLIAGDAEQTPAVLGVNSHSQELQLVKSQPGDGTVLRSSALMDERIGSDWSRTLKSPIPWKHVTFLFKDHLELTQDASFTDNVLYLLLEKPKI